MKKIFVILLLTFLVSCTNQDEEIKDNSNFTENENIEEIVNTGETVNIDTNDLNNYEELSENNLISLEEVKNHSTNDNCYTIIDGKVYDITSFFGEHPGGDKNLEKLCGIDGSKFFNSQHGENEKAKVTKETFYIGNFNK